jgi:mRNA interferase MazF
VVVQANPLLALSTVVVCPTSVSVPPSGFHPTVAVGDQETRVLCEMVGAVDVRALGEQVGHASAEEIERVEDGLRLVLGIS